MVSDGDCVEEHDVAAARRRATPKYDKNKVLLVVHLTYGAIYEHLMMGAVVLGVTTGRK